MITLTRLHDLLYKSVVIKDKQPFWKRILVVDDDADVTITFKLGIEDTNNNTTKTIEVYTSNNPKTNRTSWK